MSHLFNNHSTLSNVLKHKTLPIYKTKEFSFFRCVNMGEWTYNTIVSDLHKGNLRENKNSNNRYSKLFPGKKISYWSDSKDTAVAEIKKHGGNKNYLIFWAYDDVSSTFPILGIEEELIIIDGRNIAFEKILLKIEKDEELTDDEKHIIDEIDRENPDCLAYKSFAVKGGTNFLFFEKGFKKLSLREVTLYLGENKSKNKNSIRCAFTSDYTPHLENYGFFFTQMVRKRMDEEYTNSMEYLERIENVKVFYKKINDFYDYKDKD